MAATGPVETLRCPSCGAPAAPEATACPYCAAVLALVSCPSCLGRIFKGAKHCSHCGTLVEEAQAQGPSELKCPRCGVNLLSVKVGTANLGECERCGGTWVDGRTFERLVAEKDQQSLVLAATLPGFGPKTGHAHLDRYWPCPVCQRLMNRVNFAHISGVVLDACRTDGVWFDADELRQIVEFIRSGGLEKARASDQAEQDRLRATLKLPPDAQLSYSLPEDDSHEWKGVVISGALRVLEWLNRRG